jgi:fatty-acyl-CoA synthase
METPLTPLEFARRARKVYPEQIAVIDGESRWSYAQFLDRCDRWSAALQELGIGSGDRVAYLAPNGTRSSSHSTPCHKSVRCLCR